VIPLFTPDDHEPLTETPWSAARAEAAIRAIVEDAERAFSLHALWPMHPRDIDPGDAPDRYTNLYLGAAGIIWALRRLGSADDWSAIAASLPDRYRANPDFPDSGAVPSLMVGEAGVLLVAHALRPSALFEERLLEDVRANATHTSNELFWGASGTMLAAHVMHERTGASVWAEAWNDSADRLWAAWDGDIWTNELSTGRRSHVLGPAHGFAGNVLVLARGDLLDPARRAQLERRAIDVLQRHARRDDGLAQWPASFEEAERADKIRTQWCHGAPGIVTSFAALAPADDALTDLLVAGGELTWLAGPLKKGAGLCHGTAGNGYAFLKLFARTGDERWLERARAFAMHALEQVERMHAVHGQGWHSLYTGDVGTALYLRSCVDANADFPTLDVF
jgi:lanthionine synthetase-like protein